MPEVVWTTRGSEKVVAEQKQFGKLSASVQAEIQKELKKTSEVEKQQANFRKREIEQRKRAEREHATLVRQSNRNQMSDLERLQGKLKQLRNASLKFGDEEKALARERTRLILDYSRKVDGKGGPVDATNKFRSSLKDAGKQLAATFSPTRLAGFAAGFVGIHSAVRLITNELRAQQELVNKAEQAKLSVSQARNVLRRNLLSLPEQRREAIVQQFAQIARDLRLQEAPIQLAGAEGVSASGGDVQAALAATRFAAGVFPDQPQQIGEVVGSLLDLSKVTGTTDPRINFGLLLQVGALSRVVNPREQATNIAPALIGATAFGGTAQGGGALFAALTTASGDITGRKSGTAVIQLAKQLAEFEPVAGQATLTGRIQALQANRVLAEQFLDKASFEAKSLGPIRQLLLDRRSAAALSFAANLGQFDQRTLLRMSGGATRAIDRDPVGASAVRFRALQSMAEAGRLAAPGALTEEELGFVRERLQRTGVSALGTTVGEFVQRLDDGVVTLDEVIESLSSRRQRLLAEDEIPIPGEGAVTITRGPTLEEKQQAKALQDAIKQLTEVLEKTQSASLKEQQETNRKLDDSGLVGVAE